DERAFWTANGDPRPFHGPRVLRRHAALQQRRDSRADHLPNVRDRQRARPRLNRPGQGALRAPHLPQRVSPVHQSRRRRGTLRRDGLNRLLGSGLQLARPPTRRVVDRQGALKVIYARGGRPEAARDLGHAAWLSSPVRLPAQMIRMIGITQLKIVLPRRVSIAPAAMCDTIITRKTHPHSTVNWRLICLNRGVDQNSRATDSRAYCSVNGTNSSDENAINASSSAAIALAYRATQCVVAGSAINATIVKPTNATTAPISSIRGRPATTAGAAISTPAINATTAAAFKVSC